MLLARLAGALLDLVRWVRLPGSRVEFERFDAGSEAWWRLLLVFRLLGRAGQLTPFRLSTTPLKSSDQLEPILVAFRRASS